MAFSPRTVDRSLEGRRVRYEREVDDLVRAALRVMRRKGYAAATVADVLSEASLSTRAFYRHFRSREELFLSVFERDSAESSRRLEGRLAGLPGPRAQLAGWVDEVLSLAYDRARARRTRVLANEGASLRAAYPAEFLSIYEAQYAPLVRILEAGCAEGSFATARPEEDARSIHAVAWSLVEARLGGGGPPSSVRARHQVLRFCLPALGASAPEPSRDSGAPAPDGGATQ